MKKILFISLILSHLLFSSCEDYLEVDNANEVVISTVDDVKGILGGYLKYQKISKPNSGAGLNVNEAFAASFKFFPNLNTGIMFFLQTDDINPLEVPSYSYFNRFSSDYYNAMPWELISPQKDIWNKSYKVVGLMNSLLKELNEINESEEYIQSAKGEILMQRAWHIFKLLQYFGTYSNNELGIPLNTDANAIVDYDSGRKTQSEIFNIIISDIKEVLSYTAEKEPDYHVFYDNKIANALLAQVYMYKAESGAEESDDWANARIYAEEVMKDKTLAQTAQELKSIYTASNRYGLIQDNDYALLIFNQDKTYTKMFWGYDRGDRYLPLNSDLMNLFDANDYRVSDPDDSRNKFKGAGFATIDGGLRKHLYAGGQVGEVMPLFRVADMHLIIAESYARTGDTGNAKLKLNEFKVSRNTAEFTGSDADVLQEILNERRKEFCGEQDMRWIDMKRIGITVARSYNDVEGNLIDLTLNGDDFKYAFYIPDSELSLNKALNQNPGW